MLFALQFICAFLMGVGCLFIVIELRTRFDRAFLYFGIALVILCLVVGIDLWVLPGAPPGIMHAGLQTYHILSCAYIVFAVWYLMLFVNAVNKKVLGTFAIASILFMVLFLTPAFLRIEHNDVATTAAYNMVFAPYVLIFAVYVVALNTRGFRRSRGTRRRILLLHLVGLVMLYFGGIADLIVMGTIGVNKLPVPSFAVLGALVFGIMTTAIFAERFRMLCADRQDMLHKLQSAYRDLEEVSALKEMGRSAALMGHEIRNYLTHISANAQLIKLQEHLTNEAGEGIDEIVRSAHALSKLSSEVLEMGRMEVSRDKEPVDLARVIHETIRRHYDQRRHVFQTASLDSPLPIRGDAVRLEQAFVNLFNNALEAASIEPPRIDIRSAESAAAIVLAIEDNGRGCDENVLNSLFTAFYTTRKGTGGTGLGMSISRTIIERHGGRISAYSKNLLLGQSHGLHLAIAFPRRGGTDEPLRGGNENRIIIIEQGLTQVEACIQILHNAFLSAHVLHSGGDLKKRAHSASHAKVIAARAEVDAIVSRNIPHGALFELEEAGQQFQITPVDNHGKRNHSQLYTEEFAVTFLA